LQMVKNIVVLVTWDGVSRDATGVGQDLQL